MTDSRGCIPDIGDTDLDVEQDLSAGPDFTVRSLSHGLTTELRQALGWSAGVTLMTSELLRAVLLTTLLSVREVSGVASLELRESRTMLQVWTRTGLASTDSTIPKGLRGSGSGMCGCSP